MPRPLAQPLSVRRFAAPVHLDAGLVEQAVLLAVERSSQDRRGEFHLERDPIYELERARQREAAFQALHARWFDRLRLARPLLELLGEQPSIAPSISRCLVLPAARRKDEHADLRDAQRPGAGVTSRRPATPAGDDRPALVVQVLPTTLVEPRCLERLLRRELYYVADMLDPAFGYDPELAVRGTSGPLASLLRERHELLWRVAVDGRLAAKGHLARPSIESLRARFEEAFPRSCRAGEVSFCELFEGPRPSHRQLMRLARHPFGEAMSPSGECPLCGMPTPRERLTAEPPSGRAIAAARRDFAGWRPEQGMCPHCADLYELRERARPTLTRNA